MFNWYKCSQQHFVSHMATTGGALVEICYALAIIVIQCSNYLGNR